MQKKNNILNPSFMDFPVYPISSIQKEESASPSPAAANTFIVVEAEHYNDTLAAFLTKILGAVNLDFQKDVVLIPLTAKDHPRFSAWKTNQSIKFVLLFGTAPKAIGIQASLAKYQAKKIQDIQFLYADDLQKISEDVNAKKALWGCLKALYQV